MLILTRRINESIKIGNDITIHICGINGNQIKIGILAPRNIDIVRDNCKKDKLKNLIKHEKENHDNPALCNK